MIVDANLLLYAKISDYPEHDSARDWLDRVLGGPERVGLPWQSLLAFVRIGTNARVFASPMAIADAWAQVERWLDAPSAFVPIPSFSLGAGTVALSALGLGVEVAARFALAVSLITLLAALTLTVAVTLFYAARQLRGRRVVYA